MVVGGATGAAIVIQNQNIQSMRSFPIEIQIIGLLLQCLGLEALLIYIIWDSIQWKTKAEKNIRRFNKQCKKSRKS